MIVTITPAKVERFLRLPVFLIAKELKKVSRRPGSNEALHSGIYIFSIVAIATVDETLWKAH